MLDLEILAKVFEAIPMPVFIVDADVRVVATNRAMREMCTAGGVDAEQMVGKTMMDFFPFLPSDFPKAYGRVIALGESISDEVVYEVNHATMCFEVRRFPLFEQGRVTHVGVIFRDISELRKTQEALRNSEETARALMNSSTESMFLIDENETIVAANDTGAERLGMLGRDLEGMTADQVMGIMPSDVRNRRRDYYREVRKSGKSVRFTDERMGRIFDISMFPVPDSSGVARRVAIFARDVTEYESMLKAIAESEKRFRDLFEHIPVATYVWQWDGTSLILRRSNLEGEHITEGAIGSFLGTTAERMYATG